MRIHRFLLSLLLSLLLVACAKPQPLPAERAAYAGIWQGEAMSLVIGQDGNVSYKRLVGNTNKSIDAPIKQFEGNDFVVGVGPMTSKFVVTVAPHEEGGSWKMTVDGVELTRQ